MYTLIDIADGDISCDFGHGSEDCGTVTVDGRTITEIQYFARGATGRVCHVMSQCPRCALGGPLEDIDPAKKQELVAGASTLEEINTWAESEPGGHLDY